MGAEANARKEVRVKGQLATLMATGAPSVTLHCDFGKLPDHASRWEAETRLGDLVVFGYGRTAEDAIQCLVDQLRPPEAA